jgi:glycosyltransferase involved in cell wall biosynthesis
MTLPFVSVIVPVLNGESCISDCLRSLLQLEYPRERLEIIVVDNGSTDGTLELVRRFPVRLIHEYKPGSYAARNAGVRLAKGEILAFTDADCIVESNWIQEIVIILEHTGAQAVIGVADGINENACAELEQRLWESYWLREGVVTPVDTRNFAVLTSVLKAQDLFRDDVCHSADSELGVRLHLSGAITVRSLQVRVKHRNRTNIFDIGRRRERQGRDSYLLMCDRSAAFVQTYFDGVASYQLLHGLIRLDNLTMTPRALGSWLWILDLLRRLTEYPLRISLGLRSSGFLSWPLFRLYCGLSSEIGILRARREHLADG